MVARTETRLATTETKKTSVIGTRKLPLCLIWRWSRTKEWHSALAASTSLPYTQPRFRGPSICCPKKQNAEWSSHPTMITDEKQLRFCPIRERAATVHKMVLSHWFKNCRQFFSKLGSQVQAVYFFECCRQSCFLQKVLISNGSKGRMFREHILLPLLYHRQTGADFNFLQQAVHEPGELPKRKIAVIHPPRLQFS